MTAEAFYQRVKEILSAEYPAADVSFTVHLKDEELCYPVSEKDGQLLLFANKTPVANIRAHHWSFTVFRDDENYRAKSYGSVRIHQKAVADLGEDFADRIGRQLVGIAARRDFKSH